MSEDFLRPRDWTPDDDNEPDRVEVLRQAMLKQLERTEQLAKLIIQLAERQTEIVTSFASSCLTLAEHVEKHQDEIESLRNVVQMLVAKEP